MAQEEEGKRPGEDEETPPSEVFLAPTWDPTAAAFAEQTIHEYATWVLDPLRETLADAFESFSDWTLSQADHASFNQGGFLDQIGRVYLDQMMALFGGSSSPVGRSLFSMLDGAVDQTVRQEVEVGPALVELSRAARDACSYLRDNFPAILSHQWDELCDLAYQGSTDFIPVVHQLGLPSAEVNGTEITNRSIAQAEAYRSSRPRAQEEALTDTQRASAADDTAAQHEQTLFDENERRPNLVG